MNSYNWCCWVLTWELPRNWLHCLDSLSIGNRLPLPYRKSCSSWDQYSWPICNQQVPSSVVSYWWNRQPCWLIPEYCKDRPWMPDHRCLLPLCNLLPRILCFPCLLTLWLLLFLDQWLPPVSSSFSAGLLLTTSGSHYWSSRECCCSSGWDNWWLRTGCYCRLGPMNWSHLCSPSLDQPLSLTTIPKPTISLVH